MGQGARAGPVRFHHGPVTGEPSARGRCHVRKGARAGAALQADIWQGRLRLERGADRSSCRHPEGALKPLGRHMLLAGHNLPLPPWRVRGHQERDR